MVKKKKLRDYLFSYLSNWNASVWSNSVNKIHSFKLWFNCSNILNISALFYYAFRNELVTLIAQCDNALIEPKTSQVGKTFMLCI